MLGAAAWAETPPAPARPDPTAGLPPGWEEIDPRFVFLTVRLASVETSLDAVNKAMKQAGYKQTVKQGEAERYQKGNELMDRNAGGPARWQDFYGKNAEKFFYHPTDRNSSYHTETLLTQKNPKNDTGGVASAQGLPVAQRPPQFDYIYRANTDAQNAARRRLPSWRERWTRWWRGSGSLKRNRKRSGAQFPSVRCRLATSAQRPSIDFS